MSRPDDHLPAAFRRLGSVPLAGTSLTSLVQDVAAMAATVLGCPADASVTVVRGGPGRTVAWSSPSAVELDEVQYRDDAGPCLDAARGGRPVEARAADGTRWSRFARALRDAGRAAAVSHPLPVEAPVAGSLNLYVHAGGPPESHRVAGLLLAQAAVSVANLWVYEEAVRKADNLQTALASRAVIEQAKGILMARLRITADRAFEALVRTSNDTNRKLRDVAQAVVDTGEVPG